MNLRGKGHGKIFTGNSVREIQCFEIKKEASTAATVNAPDSNKANRTEKTI